MFNRATKYLEKGNTNKAISFFKKTLREREFKEAYLNLGNAYRLVDKVDLATECYLHAASLDVPFYDGKYGAYSLAYCNLGLLEYYLGNDDNAIAFYTACLDLDPLHMDAIWNYSTTLLRKGCSGEDINWDTAWKMYSYRFKRSSAVRITNSLHEWDGVSFVDKIVVLSEQGIGDKLMFGRYIHMLSAYCNTVVVQCHPSLDIFFSSWETCREPTDGYGIPICSLAKIFGFAPAQWLNFGPRKVIDGKIGIVASGSVTHANNRNRSAPGHYFSVLSEFGNLSNLSPTVLNISGITEEGSLDWNKTIESVLSCSLVISVDTSIVHLCGSLGVPCLVLQPLAETDFRWGNKNLDYWESYWYPSVTVIRNPGSWKKTFEKVITCLKQ